MKKLARHLAPVALFALLTAVMTWPQVVNLGTRAADHQDVYFNMWRFGWTAHALATAPQRVLDGNIFYPERRTLTFSDAMPVESAVAVPMLWAGIRPVLVHNLMLLAGIVFSGAGMFVLARRLTGSVGAGLTAGVVFAFAPYRFEHYMHMELQWTVWTPWAFWALDRMFEQGRRRDGALVGLFIALQFLSSIYYGAFLATLLGIVAVLLLIPCRGAPLKRRVVALAIGAVVCLGLVSPYALQYTITKSRTGGRPAEQVLMFSAKPSSYTVATETNFLYGERARARGRAERRLFPGLLPILLAVVGLLLRSPTRQAIAYLAALAAAFEMSLGMYGFSYPILYHHMPLFEGLRAPARLGVYVLFFLGLLAAYGHRALEQAVSGGREPGSRRVGTSLLASVIFACLLLEYLGRPPASCSVSEHRAASVCVARSSTSRSRSRDAPRSCAHAPRRRPAVRLFVDVSLDALDQRVQRLLPAVLPGSSASSPGLPGRSQHAAVATRRCPVRDRPHICLPGGRSGVSAHGADA